MAVNFGPARVLALAAVIAWGGTTADGMAQCLRGGAAGGTAVGRSLPLRGGPGGSPLATFNPLARSANASLMPLAYRAPWAQQQSLLAQRQAYALQQSYLQALAQPPLPPNAGGAPAVAEAAPVNRVDNASPGAVGQADSAPVDERRERLREQNAQRAFELAQRAHSGGHLASARRHYTKVVQILGADAALAQQANEALAQLADTAPARPALR